MAPSLLKEAGDVLTQLRRTTAARQRLERDIEMAGPHALSKAIEIARHDPYTPQKTLNKAERRLRERRRAQQKQRWLEALQATAKERWGEQPPPHHHHHRQQQQQQWWWRDTAASRPWECNECTYHNLPSHSHCEMCGSRRTANCREVPAATDGGAAADDAHRPAAVGLPVGPREALASVATLGAEVRRRLSQPTANPPAWLYYLRTVYEEFPPPTLPPAKLARAKGSLTQAANSQISRTVLRALMEAIRVYHPDKNRAEDHGAAWAACAEEVTKIGTELYGEYRARIEQRAAGQRGRSGER